MLAMGYTRVAVLWGGVNRWFSEDLPTEWGINVPSKDFGEKVEVGEKVPTWTATELELRRSQDPSIRVFDTRTAEEFQRFSIPGAECIPNVEIALRAADLQRQSAKSTIVINCGGRTRSIIGASTLRRMGFANVVSLKNGTSGWALAGLEIERGNPRVRLDPPSQQSLARAERHARRIAREDGVRLIKPQTLSQLQERAKHTTVYRIDVRTREEYLKGHIPGFVWFPAGQTIQRSDDAAPLRTAPIVFCCDNIARAAITASWFRRMGFSDVMAVSGGVDAWRAAGGNVEMDDPFDPPFGFHVHGRKPAAVSAKTLDREVSAGSPPIIIFVGTSREFAEGHVQGARWLSRSWLDIKIEDIAPNRTTRIILTDNDGTSSALATRDLERLGYSSCAMLAGGMRAWVEARLPIERGLTNVMAPPEDILPTIPLRSYENMMNYLRWEEALGHAK
jgi:rhodanese-related sulfurtransferase